MVNIECTLSKSDIRTFPTWADKHCTFESSRNSAEQERSETLL